MNQLSFQNLAKFGYRMPAEWESHTGTWITWPHNEETWPQWFEGIDEIFATMVIALIEGEKVHINVQCENQIETIKSLFAQKNIYKGFQLHLCPTDNEWCRDYGAIFVVKESTQNLLATKWQFNNWGNKYEGYTLNNQVPGYMASFLDVPLVAHDFVLEGGSIEVNGCGTMLTTKSCLLNPNRNPDYTKEAIEVVLKQAFAIQQIIWLEAGIEGDDTDGHIDDITRFVSPDTVVTVVSEDPLSPDFEILQMNYEQLKTVVLPNGNPLKVIKLPMPEPIFHEGVQLPASYANFYIGNKSILLPVFGDKKDTLATEILKNCFPHREIAPIDARQLVWGLGAFHCLTQQIPSI